MKNKKKNKNLNQVRKVVKKYKESNSPTDKLNGSFNKHDSKYVKVMKGTWGNKNDYWWKDRNGERSNPTEQ